MFLGNKITKDTWGLDWCYITWELIPPNLGSFKEDLDHKEKQKVIMGFKEK